MFRQHQKPLTLALSRRERGLIVVDARVTPTWDTESYPNFERPTNRLPLPRRERGLIVVDAIDAPTRDTESNTALEKHTDRLPLQGERAGGEGQPHKKSKANHPLLTTQQ